MNFKSKNKQLLGVAVEKQRKRRMGFRSVLNELTNACRYSNYKAAMFALDEVQARIAALPFHSYRIASAFRVSCVSRVVARACSETVKLYKLGAISIEEGAYRLQQVKAWANDTLSGDAIDRAMHEMQCYRLAFGQLEKVEEQEYLPVIREQQ